ncbi:hypothetical protein B0O80DRAFT_495739 [Mortierella sp. GBAus27b]|nr:hypothetical protein B0O80DRAFT_495739 [Mortierella sp. GBAus27b]
MTTSSSCSYYICIKGYLTSADSLTNDDPPISSAARKSRERHLAEYHQTTTFVETTGGVTLYFKRTEANDMFFKCYCQRRFNSFPSLKVHLTTSTHTATPRKGCTSMAEVVEAVNTSQQQFLPFTDFFNAWPENSPIDLTSISSDSIRPSEDSTASQPFNPTTLTTPFTDEAAISTFQQNSETVATDNRDLDNIPSPHPQPTSSSESSDEKRIRILTGIRQIKDSLMDRNMSTALRQIDLLLAELNSPPFSTQSP